MRSMEDIKDLRVGTRLRTLLMAEGFTEVDAKMIPLPLSAWPDSMSPVKPFLFCRLSLTDSTPQTRQAEI
jgi:hypothetical protein